MIRDSTMSEIEKQVLQLVLHEPEININGLLKKLPYNEFQLKNAVWSLVEHQLIGLGTEWPLSVKDGV